MFWNKKKDDSEGNDNTLNDDNSVTIGDLAAWRTKNTNLSQSSSLNPHDGVHVLMNEGDSMDGERRVDVAALTLQNNAGGKGLIESNTLSMSSPSRLMTDENLEIAAQTMDRLGQVAAWNGRKTSDIKTQDDISSLRIPNDRLEECANAFGGKLPDDLQKRANNPPTRKM